MFENNFTLQELIEIATKNEWFWTSEPMKLPPYISIMEDGTYELTDGFSGTLGSVIVHGLSSGLLALKKK